MSPYVAFRRQAVDQQVAQNLRALTFPAPTRGIIENENETYMQPGGCMVLDNWAPTMRGIKLRGGTVLHVDLHSLQNPAWANNTHYTPFDNPRRRYDAADGSSWDCNTDHTSAAAPTTFAQDRAAHPDYWIPAPASTLFRKPVISAFEYAHGNVHRMYAAHQDKLFEVTSNPPVVVALNQTSGNYTAAQLANAAGGPFGTGWMLVTNETGDPVLRFSGTTWYYVSGSKSGAALWAISTVYAINTLVMDGADHTIWKCLTNHTSTGTKTFAQDRLDNPGYWTSSAAPDGGGYITGPLNTPVMDGNNLCYVWKYRNRLFFIELNSMNAWYLDNFAISGQLKLIPLAGSANLGGKLMFGASWSLDAGDGLDEKCLFVTNMGEVLIFTGTNPGDPLNWRQQGRYQLSPPMGINAHVQVGGDMLVLTVDGVIPLSQAITKDAGQLELAMLTRTIKRMWRSEVVAKRAAAWTVEKWDEYGAIFVAVPGGNPGDRHCLLANNATGAWARFTNYDATCFVKLRGDLFFGTQDGAIMQAERTGFDTIWDDFAGAFVRRPYVATMVGGWEMFGASANQIVWHQARASFKSGAGEPFQPQLSATIDYQINIPPPPAVGPDPGVLDVWDQGKWGPDLPWLNDHDYAVNDEAYQEDAGTGQGTIWRCLTAHKSAATGPFQSDRAGAAANKWTLSSPPSQTDITLYAQWDQSAPLLVPVRNTMWVSIGMTGYAHAPIVQTTIGQTATPSVELISVSATYEPAGVNV